MATFRRHALAIVLLPLVLTAVAAAPQVREQETPAEKVKNQLEQLVTLNVSDQPLPAVLDLLHEQTKIKFTLDRTAIQQLGIVPEQQLVSVKLKDVKARTCLRALLAPHNLGYAILSDTVLVSTDDLTMYRQLHQRVSIDLEKVELAVALKDLARETAANILLDPRAAEKAAKAEVTQQLDDVPLETAVRVLAEGAGLKTLMVGNVLFVTTKERAKVLRGDPDFRGPLAVQPLPALLNDW